MTQEQTFLFSYRHDGDVYSLEIVAADLKEAQRKLYNMRYATYDGVKIAEIKVVPKMLQRLAMKLAKRFGVRPNGEWDLTSDKS